MIGQDNSAAPTIAVENDHMRLWYKAACKFSVPKVCVYFELKCPLAYSDVVSCVKTRIYSEMIKDALSEYSYYAELAGFHFNFQNTVDGLLLSVSGFNEKMGLLLETIVKKFKASDLNESQFARIKEHVKLT